MNKISLILIGGGGHCLSCIDVIEQEDKYLIEGILDDNGKTHQKVAGYTILGGDELIPELAAEKKIAFLITLGQIKSPEGRVKLFELLKKSGAMLATVVSPKANVSKRANLGEGTIVLNSSVINAGTNIGANNIINSMSLIEHDAQIGNHVHISTGAIINGGCVIGDKTFVGSGATVANKIRIGENVVVGAGSVVIRDILEPGLYAGNPCKKINK